MADGLRIWNASGVLTLDLTDRILRLVGTQIVAASTSGSIVNDGFLTGTPFCFCTMVQDDDSFSFPYSGIVPPIITFSFDTLFYNNLGATHRLMYGVY